MTTISADATLIFADARRIYAAALERVTAGEIRDAAKEAWCAAKRATDGLVLARTGSLPSESFDTTRSLLQVTEDHRGDS